MYDYKTSSLPLGINRQIQILSPEDSEQDFLVLFSEQIQSIDNPYSINDAIDLFLRSESEFSCVDDIYRTHGFIDAAVCAIFFFLSNTPSEIDSIREILSFFIGMTGCCPLFARSLSSYVNIDNLFVALFQTQFTEDSLCILTNIMGHDDIDLPIFSTLDFFVRQISTILDFRIKHSVAFSFLIAYFRSSSPNIRFYADTTYYYLVSMPEDFDDDDFNAYFILINCLYHLVDNPPFTPIFFLRIQAGLSLSCNKCFSSALTLFSEMIINHPQIMTHPFAQRYTFMWVFDQFMRQGLSNTSEATQPLFDFLLANLTIRPLLDPDHQYLHSSFYSFLNFFASNSEVCCYGIREKIAYFILQAIETFPICIFLPDPTCDTLPDIIIELILDSFNLMTASDEITENGSTTASAIFKLIQDQKIISNTLLYEGIAQIIKDRIKEGDNNEFTECIIDNSELIISNLSVFDAELDSIFTSEN